MYDMSEVDLVKNPSFFIEVKDDVMDVCGELGRVEKVWVEQNNSGNVWVKFHRDHIEGAKKAQHFLNQRAFDERVVTATFVPENVFLSKMKES